MWKLGLLALMLVSCKSSEPGSACQNRTADDILNGSVSTTQLGGGCDDTVMGAAVGAPCKTGSDCAPACCACLGNSGANVSVQYCKAGVCATTDEACCTFDYEDAGPDGNPLCQ
jgi:hypothetical protein